MRTRWSATFRLRQFSSDSPAKRYDVKVGNTIYQVDRVIIHGDWIEMRTDKTISQWVYAAGVVITPKTD